MPLGEKPGQRDDPAPSRVARDARPDGTESRANEGLETSFSGFVTEYGLPEPLRNVLVAGLLVDAWWPEANLVAELDSREHHGHWSAAERDRERDARLLRLGIFSLRITARRLSRDRPVLAAEIRSRFPATETGSGRFRGVPPSGEQRG